MIVPVVDKCKTKEFLEEISSTVPTKEEIETMQKSARLFKREDKNVYESLKTSLHEVELIRQGKMKKKTWKEFKEKLEKE